jgi:hypothetical protein
MGKPATGADAGTIAETTRIGAGGESAGVAPRASSAPPTVQATHP